MKNQKKFQKDDDVKSFSNSQKKNQQSILTYQQLKSLRNENSLPINIIRNFYKYLDMSKMTRTTPISTIISNKYLPWDKKELVKKKDIRMIHTKHFNLNWNYYKLTMDEPDKCNIAKFSRLFWSKKAIENIGPDVYCDEHLIIILQRYSKIDWDWNRITRRISIDVISNNTFLPWVKNVLTDKIMKLPNDKKMSVLLKFPEEMINWKVVTLHVPWEMIGDMPDLPWELMEKYCCDCGKNCTYVLPVWVLRKLKKKSLNWKNITACASYEIIYANQDFPWDEETLLDDLYAPLWFIMNTKYNWDLKKITLISDWERIMYSPPNFKWDKDELASDKFDLPPIELIIRYTDVKWNWERYSKEFSYDDILDYRFLPWRWDIIIERNNIPFVFVKEFPEKNWICNNIITNNESRNTIVKTLELLKDIFPTDISVLIFKILC